MTSIIDAIILAMIESFQIAPTADLLHDSIDNEMRGITHAY